MAISTEWLVMLAISGLYLQDCVLLLWRNEAVLEWRRPVPRVYFGADQFRIGGRDLFIPNPLTPWRPVFRLAWQVRPRLAGNSHPNAIDLENAARQLGRLSWHLLPIALGLFIGIPLCLRLNAGWACLGLVVGLVYAGVSCLLVRLWSLRKSINLSNRGFASLAFEAIACAPVALNLVRRISRAWPVQQDLVMIAKTRLPPHASRAVIAEVIRRVDDDLAATEAGEDDWNVLTAYRARLMANDDAAS
jgi:hypothetical protein